MSEIILLEQPKYRVICPITSQTLHKNKYGGLEWVTLTPKGEWDNSEFTEKELLDIDSRLMNIAKELEE